MVNSIDMTDELGKHDDLLRSTHLAMLSTIRVRDGLISTNPVGFVWDGVRIRISTLKSRVKYHNIAANPTVAFCLIEPNNPTRYLEVRGHATLEDDPGRVFARLQFMTGSGGNEPPADMDPADAERAIIVIHPAQISRPALYGGRFDRK
jgi:PPOX class probable F420-dependent enzyme